MPEATADEPPREVFVSARLSKGPDGGAALVRAVQAQLEEGETLLAVVAVVKIFPALEVMAMTGWRVVAGAWREIQAGREDCWAVRLAVVDIDDVEVKGFMDNVLFVHSDGSGTKVGNLWDQADGEAIRAALQRARGLQTMQDPGLLVPVVEPAPSWQVYEPPTAPHDPYRRRRS